LTSNRLLDQNPVMVAQGIYRMKMAVLRRPWRSAFGWVVLACLCLGLGYLIAAWARKYLAIDRDARSARRAISSGHRKQAHAPLARWLRAQPRSAEAHALMALVALDDGDLAKVTDELNQARALGFPASGLERIHAVSLARIGRYAEAEPILTRLYNSSSRGDPTVEEALARVYMMTHRLRPAQAVIEQWIRDAPDDGRPYLWLTEFDRRMESDNLEALEKHFREALRRDPDLDKARLGLAETLRKAFRNTEAKREFDLYLARHPDDPIALAGAGRNALDSNDPETAIRLLDRARALAPDEPNALKGRAAIDFARGEPKAALARLDQALQADPYDTEALYNRSRVRSALGDDVGAKNDLDAFRRYKADQAELVKIFSLSLANPSNNDLRSKIAAWMFAHGRDDDGLGWAKAVLASDPDHAATNALLADYYGKRKNQAGLANFYQLKAQATRNKSH
jgi:tetratricopeptide (TPR) repeat protein